MENFLKVGGALLGAFAAVVAFGLLVAWPFEVLLNWLINPNLLHVLFGVVRVTFWQAWGILALIGFIKSSVKS